MTLLGTKRSGGELWASSSGGGAQGTHRRGYGAASESAWARQVMRDAGVQTWEQ